MSSSYYARLINEMSEFKSDVKSLISNLKKRVTEIENIKETIMINYKKNDLSADKNKSKSIYTSLNNLVNSLEGSTIPGIDQKIAELRRSYNAAVAREEQERREREEAERKAREEAEAAAN